MAYGTYGETARQRMTNMWEYQSGAVNGYERGLKRGRAIRAELRAEIKELKEKLGQLQLDQTKEEIDMLRAKTQFETGYKGMGRTWGKRHRR